MGEVKYCDNPRCKGYESISGLLNLFPVTKEERTGDVCYNCYEPLIKEGWKYRIYPPLRSMIGSVQ